MGVLTTADLHGSAKSVRCGKCSASITAAVADANGRFIGICCATGWRREELERMGADVELGEKGPLIAHDPFVHGARTGPTAKAAAIVNKLREMGISQASPEAVELAQAAGAEPVVKPQRMAEPALPEPPVAAAHPRGIAGGRAPGLRRG